VVGIILVVAVSIALVALGANIVFNLSEDTNEPVKASPKIELSEDSMTVAVVRSEGAEKFIVTQTGNGVLYTTTSDTWTRSLPKSEGKLVIKAVAEESGSEQILLTRNIPSGSNLLSLGDGRFIDIDSRKIINYGINPEVQGSLGIDYVGNGGVDFPIVNGSGDLVVADSDGSSKKLVDSSDAESPRTTKSIIGVFSWMGSKSIFYAGQDENIYSVDYSGSPSVVANPSNGVDGVLDSGDIDSDGSKELVFADGSQQLRYIDEDSSISPLSGGQLGSNNGIGATADAVDFDGDGTPRLPIVDGGNNVVLVGESESDVSITGASAKKAPISSADVDGDGRREVIYTDKSSGNIKYVDDVLDSQTISNLEDKNGNNISGDDEAGLVS
jgi:hypothetical protein